jgi:hypothetical protein
MAKKSQGPCWDGYEMVGMKKKGSRSVPNCVPVKKKFAGGLIPDVSSAMAMASQASPQDYKDYKMSGNIKPQKIEAKSEEVTEAYSGKFIDVEMDGKRYGNPSLKSYYNDLLK